jgi:pilus assembly protein CpaC
MDFSRKQALSVLALTLAAIWVVPNPALSGGTAKNGKRMGDAVANGQENSVVRIAANSNFPVNRSVNIGVGRSVMIQFPMELKDVMVSDPEKVDIILQTNDRVFLIAKKPGTANVFFFDTQSNQIASIDVNIGSDLSSLDALFKRLIPSSNIKSELAGATIVLTGTVRSPSDSQRAADLAKQYAAANKGAIGANQVTATTVGNVTTWQSQSQSAQTIEYKSVINMIQVDADEQVMLKVTVAEVNRSVLKQFGINVSHAFAAGRMGGITGTNNGASTPSVGTTPGTLLNCGANLPDVGAPFLPQAGAILGFATGAHCLAASMRAMETQGLLRTLAEPTLTAVSGESAKFLAGGEYPVPVANGNGAFNVTFKEFGVAVAFTPMVLSEGRISLKIDTGVSELSTEGAVNGIPSLRKRSAVSTVELPSGGTMALAGLINDTTRQTMEGMPGLKDIPILGTLFRSREFNQNESELVIIVTPYLVRPTARQNISAPTDGLAPASDLKANFLGQINRVYGRGTPIGDGGLKGNHGFIVD